ncbi:MAG: C40 family peptidase [Parafilimonas sp.]|nr:C40 family peptidase [Parafilimonas sp.]
MNIRLTQTVCLLLILCSCKSLRPVASRNSSAATVSPKKDPRFLDNVSMTPGEKKNSTYTYNKSNQLNSKKSFNTDASSLNIEKADWLQIKYAIMTDMPVEQLNDLPLLQQIDHWWGTRYCMGGDDESCIDCSAFTQTLLRNVYGVNVPRTAQQQYDFSTHINDSDLQEGDLVFFKSGRYISHVGLYLGNNKFVNASTSSGVTISDLNDPYWNKKYAGAGRVIQ